MTEMKQAKNIHKRFTKSIDNDIVAEKPRDSIPPGIYEAICYEVNIRPCQGGSKRVFIEFRICSGEHQGTEIFMCCPKPDVKLRERHKLHTQMSLALGRRLFKGERFVKSMFVGKMFNVRVRDTRKKFSECNKTMPGFMQYSVVDSILEVLAGGPVEQ